MKKLLMFLFAIAFTSVSWGQTYLSESFEGTWSGTPAAPSGWSQTILTAGSGSGSAINWAKNTYSGSWSISCYGYPTGAQSGSSVAWFKDYSSYAGRVMRLSTGDINLSASVSPTVTFYYVANTSATFTLKVRASNDGGLTWSDVLTPTKPGTTWTKNTIALAASYKVSNARIAFEITGAYGNYDAYIDNFLIAEPPSPITGIKTIKASGGTYSSFTSAINDLNYNGVGAGGVIFNVDAGFVSTENCPAITVNATSANPVIFQKSGVGANPIIKAGVGSGSSDAIVTLKGCDYVTFDGIDLQENSANTTTTQQAEYGFYVLNNGATDGAQNNTIKNSKITLNRTNTSTKAIYQYYGTTPTNQLTGCNNYNKYYNLTIENTYSAVYFNAYSSTYFDSGTELGIISGGTTTIGGSSANDIGNGSSSAYGIYAYYQSGLKVFNTEIRNIGATTNVYGIYLSSCIGTTNLYNNKIHDLKNTSTSSTSPIYGIYAASLAGTTPVANIYNNLVYNITSNYTGAVTATRVLNGIYLSNSTASQNFNLYFNSVKIDGSNSLNVSSTCFQSTGTSTGGILTMNNNIFANLTAPQTGVAKHYAWVSPSATLIGPTGSTSDYNNLYSNGAGAGNGYLGLALSTDIADIGTWMSTLTGTANLEINSIEPVDPGFTPALIPIANKLDGTGLFIPSITTDITGATRNDPPDYGAYEFDPPNPCATPVDQPTALNLTSVSNTSISGTFTAAASAPDKYLVVRSSLAVPDADPVDQTTYSVGSIIGSGVVVKVDELLNFTATGLTAGTQYYFYVYAYNNLCQDGPLYNILLPLSGNQYTLPNAPATFTATVASSSQINLAATANAQANDIIVAWNSTNTFGTPTGTYNIGDPIAGGGTILYSGSAAGLANHSSLNSATTYYYKVWSKLGTYYSSGLTANATTLCNAENIPTSIQSFESVSIPVCWSTSLVTGTYNWAPTTNNDGVPSPHTGINFMGKVYSTSDALIYSQPINMTSALNGGRINVWIYRSASNLASDRIRFHINTTQSLTGATQLLEIFPKTTIAPVVTTAGWYNYIVNIPISYNSNSSVYIIAQGTTSGGYSSYGLGFDDFNVEAIPSCVEPNTLAVNSITNNSATATWVAGATETLWNLEYGVAGFSQGAGTLVNDLSSTTYNFTSLTGNTNYSFYVQANCGSSTSPWSGPYTFKTLCDAVSIPITQNFDGVTTPNLPDCWTKKVVSTSSAALTTSTTYHSASNGVYFSNSGDAASQLFLISPKIVQNLNTLRVKLWAYSYGTYPVKVGVMTDPTDAATFVEIASYPTSSTWTERITDLNSYSGSATYIAIKFVGTGTYQSIYVDDISIDLLPTCLEPTALNASNVTLTNATINWTASTSNPTSGYEYEVRTSGAAGSGATGLVTSGTTAAGVVTANISSLTANTNYSFYVRSNCGSNYSSWTSAGTFFTGYCNPAPTSVDGSGITNVSFSTVNNTTSTETGNYGNYSAMIGDIQRSTTVDVSITYATGFTYDTKIWIDWNDDLDFADVGEEVYSGTSLSTNPTTLAASFVVPLTATLGQHRMRIGGQDAGPATPCYSGTYGSFEDYTVNVLEAPSCLAPTALLATPAALSADLSWTEAGTATSWDIEWGTTGFTPTGTPTITGVTNPYTLNGLAQSTTYAYYVRANCGGTNSTWTGPKTFTTTVACPAPTTLTTNSTTATTANLSWTSTATAFEIEYGVAPYTFTGTANVTNILATNKEITGLQTATTYQYKVKAICGGLYGESLWSATGTFTTACDAMNIPYTQNFDGVTAPSIPNCMIVTDDNGISPNWVTATGGVTANAMKIGYTAAGAGPLNDWFFTPSLNLTAGKTYKVSFKYKGGSSSYVEKLEVKWGAGANATAMTSPAIFSNISFYVANYQTVNAIFTPISSGLYNVGWHAFSIEDQMNIFVDDISITEAQAGLWTGSTNNDWSTATNWDNLTVPTAVTNVTIPATAPNFPTLTAPVTVNNLTIESNASGTGSLLDGGFLTLTGIATVKQYIAADKWHFISSPVSSATTNVFSPALNSNIPIYIRNWNQTSQTWEDIVNLTTNLTVGKGYAIWGTGSSPTIVYNGSLNNTSSISYGAEWNFVANPFVSALDWNAASLTGKPGSNYFYCWNTTGFTTSNGSLSTNLPLGASANIIPAMQGFFMYSASAGALGGLSGARTHNNHPLYKNTNTLNDVIRITAHRGVYKDEALFAYNSLALNGFNETYDARKLFANNNNIPDLYTISNSKEIAIKNFGNYPASFPINIRMGVADNVTLTASEFANFDASVNITLEDMLTGTTQDLRQNPSYTFAASIGENANRFVLHFATASGINSPNAGNISIYANENTIYVNTTEKVKEISVYNMLGQIITSVSGSAKSLQTISIDNASGNYVVKVTTEKGVKTEKVFVK